MGTIDQRRLPRAELAFYIPIHDRETGDEVGRMVDITPEGMRLVTDAPVELERVFEQFIEVEDSDGVARRLEVVARSVWCQPDTNPDHFAAGLQIIGARAGAGYSIERFIREHSLRSTWADDEMLN